MKIVIVKYNAGNVQSVLFALERIGAEAVVSDNPEEIKGADKVIFPGVGAAGTAMAYLRERKLDQLIKDLQQPVLGICLGMQLMCAHSEESDTTCLGIFKEEVKRFAPAEPSALLKVPQMGWNKIYNVKSDLMEEVSEGYCYFVHSYYAALGEHTIATADYIQPYSAALHRDNFYGVQFHPEKSAETGEKILANFLTRI
ncbi:imidazole glycerol phosphate synthase subunit HisH [Aridibaculum aurantiacum]|uniref:imidazole glycerol phosphate synthase subunit HisH n=1 Tax=Aridibaculum aurantiacum TaxID=2810307 RepID=UPI001A974623|nr:imidazole glycerol phosphate synthase subunit HisH [Aridibaculum aurantiacum]